MHPRGSTSLAIATDHHLSQNCSKLRALQQDSGHSQEKVLDRLDSHAVQLFVIRRLPGKQSKQGDLVNKIPREKRNRVWAMLTKVSQL